MGKKKGPSKYVKKLRPLEKDCIKGHWHVGSFTKEQIQKEWSINDSRLRQMLNSNYLKMHRGKYTIGEKGKEYCRSIGMRNQYKKSSFQHDNRLADVYLGYSREEREGWMTESELRQYASKQPGYNDFKKRMIKIHSRGKFQATPDAAIKTKDGKLIAIEVVTRNYSDEAIIQKNEFAKQFLDGIDYYEA